MPDATESSSPLFTALGADAKRLASDAAEMLQLRRELVEMEVRSDIASSKRLGITGGVGLVLTLTGLPVLAVLASSGLNRLMPLGKDGTFNGWLLIVGSLLVAGGFAAMHAAWRRFRRDFLGLKESAAELKEDIAWLREWASDDE